MSSNLAVVPLNVFLKKKENHIQQMLPKSSPITVERVQRIILNQAKIDERFRACTNESILNAVLECCKHGLIPGGVLGHAYLIPYNNNQKQITECQFMLGYKGMVNLIGRSEKISHIHTGVIRQGDIFDIQMGSKQNISHIPALMGRGEVIGAYSVATYMGGGTASEFMNREEIEEIRAKSSNKSKYKNPWIDNFPQMARKCPLRRQFNYLPIDIEIQRLVALDDAGERGEQQESIILEGESCEVFEDTGEIINQSDKLAEKLA